jgi:uncharacterized phage-associated protein
MLNAVDVAKYFFKKDKNRELFNGQCLVKKNGRSFYEGNARINKYLHITQNVWIAMTGEKLIDVDFYAYDNGAVVLDVLDKYLVHLNNISSADFSDFTEEIKSYLDKIYLSLENAYIDELIDLSHEDAEWDRVFNFKNERGRYATKEEQKMDSLRLQSEYKQQYKNFIWALERLNINE